MDLTLQLAASVTTLAAMWLMGNKHPYGPPVAVVSEIVWAALIVHTGMWGILPLTAALIFIHSRNTLKWMGW